MSSAQVPKDESCSPLAQFEQQLTIAVTQFEQQLAVVVNRWINQTGTVDAVLAQYVTDSLIALNHARNALAQIPAHAVPQS